MFDLNDAQPQSMPAGDIIPDGTFAKLRLSIRPGQIDGALPADKGLLKASGSSDAKMLDCEMTVVEGPYARRKLWQNYTVAGGKVDENGVSIGWKISKAAFRAMIDSALGLDPKDMSEAAKGKRVLSGLRQLDGIVFAARIMVEPASNAGYKDQNRIANVVEPGDPAYAAVMRGEPVAPEPVNAKPRKAQDAPASQTPAWSTQGAAPASAPASPATGTWPSHGSAARTAPQQPASRPAPLVPTQAPAAGPAWLNG